MLSLTRCWRSGSANGKRASHLGASVCLFVVLSESRSPYPTHLIASCRLPTPLRSVGTVSRIPESRRSLSDRQPRKRAPFRTSDVLLPSAGCCRSDETTFYKRDSQEGLGDELAGRLALVTLWSMYWVTVTIAFDLIVSTELSGIHDFRYSRPVSTIS